MPIDFVPSGQVPHRHRRSKIESTKDWKDILHALAGDFPKDKTLRVVLGDETISLFKNASKASQAFAFRLRRDFGQKFKVRRIGSEIYISKEKKS